MILNGIVRSLFFPLSLPLSFDYYLFHMFVRSIFRPLFLCPHLMPSSEEPRFGWEGEKNGNKITSFSGYSFCLHSVLLRLSTSLRFLFRYDSRFSKLVFNIQSGILIKSNLSIPLEYISRNDKI